MSMANDHFLDFNEMLIKIRRWGGRLHRVWDEHHLPTGTLPKLQFHEGPTKNGLNLFRLPYREENDRFSFGEVFGHDMGEVRSDNEEDYIVHDADEDNEGFELKEE